MKTLRRFLRRLTSWTTSARDEEFLRAEIEDHVAMQAADYVRGGLSPEEARRQALLKFGSMEAIKESYRDQRGLPLLETLGRDTRHALRRFRKNPVFTAAVVLTLALGIGGNTAIFGVIESVLIRPLPYPDAEALVGVWHTAPGMSAGDPRMSCSPSMYFTYRDENRTFQHFGLWRFGVAPVTGAGEPELPRALMVTHGVLDALDVKPLLGRWFSPADDTPGSPETVILTHGYWRRRFLGDSSVIGRAMTINARPHTVIGVMPEAFQFSRNSREPELILPLRFERSTVNLGTFAFQGIARLRPGVTMAARQRGSGSHAGSLVAVLAVAAGIRQRGLPQCPLRTADPALEAGDRRQRGRDALGGDGDAGDRVADCLRQRRQSPARGRRGPRTGTGDPGSAWRRLAPDRAGNCSPRA